MLRTTPQETIKGNSLFKNLSIYFIYKFYFPLPPLFPLPLSSPHPMRSGWEHSLYQLYIWKDESLEYTQY